MQTQNKTYDIVFNDNENSNCKGFKGTIDECKSYIAVNLRYTPNMQSQQRTGYFIDYAGGTVSIVCNETGETVYSEPI